VTILDVPFVKPDLSDLPAEGWFRWPWGHETALVRRIDDRRYVAVIPFIYTSGVVWGHIDSCTATYEDRWCYHAVAAAVVHASAWQGPDGEEPDGWHRHPATGRRRDAHGNEWVGH